MVNIPFQTSKEARSTRNPLARDHSCNEEAKVAQKEKGCELAVVVLKFSAPIDLRPKLPRSALAPQRESVQIAAGQ